MVIEYVYFDVNGEKIEVSHSTRNKTDKYADNQPAIKIEGDEEYVDFVLDLLFEQ